MQKDKQSVAVKAMYWLKVVSLGMILGLSLQFVQAWTAPTLPPPGGNVAGPVTTGSAYQTKTGGLGLTGDLVVGAAAPALPQKICMNGVCRTTWPSGSADNLGNHVATIDLDLSGNDILNIGTITTNTICLNGDCRSNW